MLNHWKKECGDNYLKTLFVIVCNIYSDKHKEQYLDIFVKGKAPRPVIQPIADKDLIFMCLSIYHELPPTEIMKLENNTQINIKYIYRKALERYVASNKSLYLYPEHSEVIYQDYLHTIVEKYLGHNSNERIISPNGKRVQPYSAMYDEFITQGYRIENGINNSVKKFVL